MKLLIADDHNLAREGLALILQASLPDCHTVWQSSNWAETWDILCENQPDVALLDLFMPGAHVWQDELRALHEHTPGLPICIFSSESDPDTIRLVMELGVRGFVHKSATSVELLGALQQVLMGKIYYPRQLSQHPSSSRIGFPKPVAQSSLYPLTSRQTQILGLIARGGSNRQIADSLKLTENTVKRHVYNLCKTLHVASRVEALHVARRHGLLPS